MSQAARRGIVPRQGLDFHLREDDIPRYWLGGDPFRTRFFDAMSLLFPEGEKFFIQCVRDFRDRIEDPELEEEVKHFTFQEGQHSQVHIEFNKRVGRQGVHVRGITDYQKRMLGWFRKRLPAKYTLAMTAAAEHMTALMAHFFLENPEEFESADPRIRAIYFWHAIEEIEHKGVAFDVYQRIAKGGYLVRVLAMLQLSVDFPYHTLRIMWHMHSVDGIRGWRRVKLWARGLWWLYGPGGVYGRMMRHYLAYYRPGYHPWKHGETVGFERWRQAYQAHDGDAIAATESFYAAL